MKIDNEVRAILERATIMGKLLLLPEHLTRPLYMRTNVVLEAAGAKWDRKQKGHLFSDAPDNLIENIITTGEIALPKDFGYFPSPPAVVARLLELAELRNRHVALEPSAGRGAIAGELAKIARRVDCIELLDANVTALHEMRARGDLPPTVEIEHRDFLSVQPHPIYDRIVMNPPFARQADVHHVMHALKFLRPLGLLVSVMGAGITFRDNRISNEFRALVEAREGTIEHLPDNSFASSGTNVNTVIVTIPGA